VQTCGERRRQGRQTSQQRACTTLRPATTAAAAAAAERFSKLCVTAFLTRVRLYSIFFHMTGCTPAPDPDVLVCLCRLLAGMCRVTCYAGCLWCFAGSHWSRCQASRLCLDCLCVWICAQAAGFLVCKVCLRTAAPAPALQVLVLVMSPKSQGVNMPAYMQVGLPPVVGMVGVGLLLRNVPGGVLRVSSHAAWCAVSLHCTMPH